MFEHALATQCRVWGGSANVPFALTDELIDSELFWALNDLLDPDGWVTHTGKLADLEELAPTRYAAAVAELEAEYSNLEPMIRAGAASINLHSRALVDARIPDGLDDMLRRRLATLDLRATLDTTRTGQQDEPPLPLTDALALDPSPDPAVILRTDVGDTERLMLTAQVGRFSARSEELQRSRVTIHAHDMSEADVLGILIDDLAHWNLPWRVSEVGLGWYQRTGHREATVVVAGDGPMDFSLFYGLRRLRGQAEWLPSALADHRPFVARLAQKLRNRATALGGLVLVVSAAGDATRSEAAVSALSRDCPGFEASAAHWREALPVLPNRLYEMEGYRAPQSLAIINGRSPEVVSPLPATVTTPDPGRLHWMSELSVRDWQPVRHRALGPHLAPIWDGDDGLSRAGADGLAWRCPPAVLNTATLAGVVTNPELRAMPLEAQAHHVLEQAGWRSQRSDKGTYAAESAALFGGVGALCEVVRDPGAAAWLRAFSGPDRYGMPLKDQRRYVTYQDVASRFEFDADGSLRLLEGAGALVRGLVLKCKRCRNAAFYEVEEITREFSCRRCRQEQPVDSRAWLGHPEPPWHYGLNEVLFQLFEHNGQLALLAQDERFRDQRWPFDSAFEVESWPPDELRLRADDEPDKREIDIVASHGPRLWVGEASVTSCFGTGAQEMLRLREFAQFARVMNAYGALFATSATEFRRSTKERIETAVGEEEPLLRVDYVEGVRLWPELPARRSPGT